MKLYFNSDQFLIKLLKYPFRKGRSFYHAAVKSVKRHFYKNASFSDINLMIETKYHRAQYEYVTHNKWYSHALVVKTYAGFSRKYKLPVSIEHGVHLYPDDTIIPEDIHIKNNLPGLFVCSNNRKEFYARHTNKEIIPIGPFIHYASPLLDGRRFKQEKARLGKSLLIMPAHNDFYSKVSLDYNSFYREIRKIARDFDTIRVCLHHVDVADKKYEIYKEMGFDCVCAGEENSDLFMPRLRSIIELSDFIISDNVSTALGYCVYLKKPHMLIDADMDIEHNRPAEFDQYYKNIISGSINKEFFRVFSRYDDKITQEQLALVENYWGLSSIKPKDEIRAIILDLAQKMPKQGEIT